MTKRKPPKENSFAEWGIKPDAEAMKTRPVTRTRSFAVGDGHPRTVRERQAAFREARKADGFVLVREWVPKECAETLRRIAAEMRVGREAPTSTDQSEQSKKSSEK